ncbi:Hypothetical predicted protein [Podarcis lilfordi]|uniref:Uncharacterized protein n=1 Tax=Podarcis lilfordi TaxID=74358 RepID=A0AA35LKQ9_9SAUR|nr:Hypothetical predicted protein [Podarcis lilfordi]
MKPAPLFFSSPALLPVRPSSRPGSAFAWRFLAPPPHPWLLLPLLLLPPSLPLGPEPREGEAAAAGEELSASGPGEAATNQETRCQTPSISPPPRKGRYLS